MTTMEAIRSLFPAPVSGRKEVAAGEHYCVGGAVCLYEARRRGRTPGLLDHFPPPSHLAQRLMALNPAIGYDTAWGFAMAIVRYNDEGRMHVAWQGVHAALESVSPR